METTHERCAGVGRAELRDLSRARKQLVQERTRYVQRIQKVLEDANLKIASFITDLLGKSGLAALTASVEGYTKPSPASATEPPTSCLPRSVRT